jgi:hypothetical protein
MLRENWPRIDHPSGCRCPRCRRQRAVIDRLADRSLSVALRHAQGRFEDGSGPEAATPGPDITLPGKFSGWHRVPAVTLAQLFSAGPPAPFTTKSARGTGPGYLYRVYEEYRQRPLYIGMAYDATIRARVASHVKRLITKSGTLWQTQQAKALAATTPQDFDRKLSEIAKLRILVAQLAGAGNIKVQCGTVMPNMGYLLDAKFLHAFEAALQILEKPKSYVGSSRTFEESL